MIYALILYLYSFPFSGTPHMQAIDAASYKTEYPKSALSLSLNCGQDEAGQALAFSLKKGDRDNSINCDCPEPGYIQIYSDSDLKPIPTLEDFDFYFLKDFFAKNKIVPLEFQVFKKDEASHFIFVTLDAQQDLKYWRYLNN